MKVKFNYGIRTYSGTIDEMTFESCNKGKLCLGHKHVKQALTENNTHMGAIGKNLVAVYKAAATEYKADLKTYDTRRKAETGKNPNLQTNAFGFFVKLMFAWAKTDPTHIDLTAITVSDIVTRDADVRTVKRAVTAAYLPSISNYADLNSDIQ